MSEVVEYFGVQGSVDVNDELFLLPVDTIVDS